MNAKNGREARELSALSEGHDEWSLTFVAVHIERQSLHCYLPGTCTPGFSVLKSSTEWAVQKVCMLARERE